MIAGYGWRKYECGVPVYRATEAALDPGYRERLLWPAVDEGQFPLLNRWEKLEEAFVGFVSRGLEEPHACAYSASIAMRIVSDQLLSSRMWIDGIDAADAYEFFLTNFLGVWFGDRTPFFLSQNQELSEILKNQN